MEKICLCSEIEETWLLQFHYKLQNGKSQRFSVPLRNEKVTTVVGVLVSNAVQLGDGQKETAGVATSKH